MADVMDDLQNAVYAWVDPDCLLSCGDGDCVVIDCVTAAGATEDYAKTLESYVDG